MLATIEDARDDQRLVVEYPYFEADAPLAWDDPLTYTDGPPLTNTRHYEWNHGLGETISAIIEAGFRLEFVHEHMEFPARTFPWLEAVPGPRELWRLPERHDRLPMMFSLMATRIDDAALSSHG
jgi:hypothetical protein